MPATSNEDHVPVAIIGLACRFPGDATSPSKYWSLLKDGRDAHSPTTDRYNADAFYHPKASSRQNVLATKGGHFLKQDIYAWDAPFFKIIPEEANAFDPKQRLALEVAYEALENAGQTLRSVAGTQTTCYIGSSMSDYRDAVVRDFGHSPKYHILGTCEEMISNRISHFLDIHGPSATIHTACSSSLVATHLACQSLQSGESEMAIAGGVGMIITPDGNMQLNNLGFLNPEGHSCTFDEKAGGYGRGEGCGVLILKRLDRAVADGDNIRAVIRASGANSDGWTPGVTHPSSEAQAALIKYVYESHGLDYSSTQYVEAHGTGTKAGDLAETTALHRTFGQATTKSRKLIIGSVKPNIGHLEAAAGVAGIIKGVLAMESGFIPPNIHFSRPNPEIPLDEWNFTVPTKLTPWPISPAGLRRMSVSGFGMGGTNGHVVLESYTPKLANGHANSCLTNGHLPKYLDAPSNAHAGSKRLFVLSSQDQAGIKRIADTLVQHLDDLGPLAASSEYLANLAHTLSVARSDLSWKSTYIEENVAGLREQLTSNPGGNAARASSSTAPRIGYIFTGQGAQWAKMGLGLLHRPVFRESVKKSTQILRDFGSPWDPISELSKEKADSRLGVPEISQPICTVLQIALVDELQAWGIAPSKVLGHSSGEMAAAYSIGALSHRDALCAAYFRGVVSQGLKRLGGSMMAVACSQEDAQELINSMGLKGGHLTVACVNSPSNVTISGDIAALEQLQKALNERGVWARRLNVEVAYHSAHTRSAIGEYSAAIADIEPLEPADNQGIMISTVSGEKLEAEDLGSYHWIQNLVSPVLFSDAVKEMISPTGENTIDHLIEIGPHSALRVPIEEILAYHGIKNVGYKSMLIRFEDALHCALDLASDLFMKGVHFDMQKANGDSHCRLLTDLPPYPWNHSKTFRAESRMHREFTSQKHPTRSLIGALVPTVTENEYVWRSFIRLSEEPWLRGHTVGGTVLFPGAGIVSIILEAVQQLVDPGKTAHAYRLRDVNLFAAIALPEDVATELIIHLRPHAIATSGSTPASWWEWTVSSCVGSDQLRDNARGLVTINYKDDQSEQMTAEDRAIELHQLGDYRRVLEECPGTYDKQRFYQHMVGASWTYGELFQGVENVHPGDGKTTFDIRLVDIGETFSKGQLERPFLMNAASLDAIFQSWLGSTYKEGAFEFDKPFVPTSIGELEISARIPADADYIMPGLCRSERYGFSALSADIAIFDTELSTVFLSVKDFRTSELDIQTDQGNATVDPAHITSEVRWDYALDLLRPAEVGEITKTVAVQERLADIVRIALHEKPAASVIELLQDASDTTDAVMSRIPKYLALPSQIRYAITKSTQEDNMSDDYTGFQLLSSEKPDFSPAADDAADLLVISKETGVEDPNKLVSVAMEKLAKSDATVVIFVPDGAPSSTLTANGFQIIAGADGGSLALRRATPSPTTNGATEYQVVLLQHESKTSSTEAFTVTLKAALEKDGHTVSTRSWGGEGDLSAAKGVTYISLLELEKPILESLSSTQFENIRSVILNCERLLWITGGGNPSFSVVDGFARCIMSEIASSRFQILHLDDKTGTQHAPSLAARILESKSLDNEFREVKGMLQVPRIFNSDDQNAGVRYHLEDSTNMVKLSDHEEALQLTIGKPGLLDTLRFIPDERMTAPLKDFEVEVQVKATGLNFRDIMACMGLIPVRQLGQEASGVVIRTGAKAAADFKPGDRVSTMNVGTHATRIRTDYRVMAKIPDAMTFQEAAAVPVVHTAAYYALVTTARLREGQSVLIHAAAGGVGQAAIQLAKHLGLVAYATVGTEEKKNLLMKEYGIPAEHIFNSRDSSFVKGIHRVTNGRGVDCVLNSLSGELLRASWSCLATFGHFVEIGLRDITDNMRLDMRPFSKCTSFTFINTHALFVEDPAALGVMLKEIFKLMERNALGAPRPTIAHPIGQVGEAFRTMQQGKHLGKLVLSFDEEAQAPVLHLAKKSLSLDPNGTYLIVGGLGGLGRSLAKEFVACGARNIAFISRSGDSSPQAKALVDELTVSGACVKAYRADIADEGSFLAGMSECAKDLPPIRGVVQMAMVLRDTVFEKMTYEEWTIPMRPKIQGTWNLHSYFNHDRPLDFMVICSSTSGLYGYPSQAQYAAGNTYQDALAHHRRAQGLKAMTVDLGIMRDVGVLAESGTTGNIKLWEEVLGIREPAFHALMKSLINQQKRLPLNKYPAQVGTGLGTADIMATHGLDQPEYFQDPRFGPLAITSLATASTAKDSSASVSGQLSKAKNMEQASDIVSEALISKTAQILQVPPSEINADLPLYRYGVDSLVALEVRNWISRELKANMALLEILAAVPISSFAGKIAERSTALSFS